MVFANAINEVTILVLLLETVGVTAALRDNIVYGELPLQN
ncbi:MAG: hypothetical protein RBG13Loki_0954 [Promethearchaeota archaeon CR_4]|nr:MAG: hypothetical protein RBG13Loki_0954 [Candidatus Lokiarchaeota archaeon CR_4]